MAKRPRPTLADYVVTGIAPALIMLLVGSLTFFLVAVFYQGQHGGRLSFIMAMFVMAAVSIARISIEEGRGYAALFALPLGAVVLLAMFRFVQFGGPLAHLSPFVNIGLIALVWWSADKLTWDCTVIDEQQDVSGEGLLQTVGLDHDADGGVSGTESAAESAAAASPESDVEATTGRVDTPPRASGLWDKLQDHRRRPHAPGVWVVYFSIAALPIFGFGQWFIRADDLGNRRYVFQLLVVYVAAALGLLLMTSFLGLRRYLRQRRLEMPGEMAATWLGVGAAMIVALLLICMLLPRRNPEYSVTQLSWFAKSPANLQTSEWAVGNDGPERKDADRTVQRDDARQQTEVSGQNGRQPGGQDGGGKSGSSKSGGKGGSKGGGKSGGKSGGKQGDKQQAAGKKSPSGDSKQPSNSGSQPSDRNAKSQNQPSSDQNSSSGQDKGTQQPGSRKNEDDRPASQDRQSKDGKKNSSDGPNEDRRESEPSQDGDSDSNENRQSQQAQQQQAQQQQAQQQQAQQQQAQQQQAQQQQTSESDSSRPPQSNNSFSPTRMFQQIGALFGGFLKLAYWLVVAAIVGFLLWRYWEQVRAAVQQFLQALRDFWARLFGVRRDDADASEDAAAPAAPMGRPFSDFRDPFQSGLSARMSPHELVKYSFDAFEAWSREHGRPRDPDETPLEFARDVAREVPSLAHDAPTLAELYNRSLYGRGSLPRTTLDRVARFWRQLTVAHGQTRGSREPAETAGTDT